MNGERKDESALTRRVQRELAARREAERLLEEKSREVFLANQELSDLAEHAQQQADQLGAIVDNVGEGIITYSDAGRILSFNLAAEKIFKCSNIEASLMKISDLIPFLGSVVDEVSEATNALSPLPFEQLGRNADGVDFPIEVVVSSFLHSGKRVHTALIRDRTTRKHLEQKLAHAQKMETVGELAAGIAHEINTPMQFVGDNTRFLGEVFSDVEGLLKLCEQLSGHPASSDELHSVVTQIIRTAQCMDLPNLQKEIPAATQQTLEGIERISSIILALKEFSHPGDQRKIAIDLNQAIRNSIALSRNHWKYVAEIELDLVADLSPIECYAGEFNQVILNLLTNAAYAIEDRGRSDPGQIKIVSRLEGDWVTISVSDNGIGMTEDVRARIFEPFFTTKPIGKGTGQGLSICYAVIVDKHDGKLDCVSTPGIGTTFTIRLPFVAKSRVVEKKNLIGSSCMRDITVLFVDDDTNILSGLKRILRSSPPEWKLRFANSGKEALETLANNPIHLVVSDMRMPEMNGTELLGRVKRSHPKVVRGILSGQAETKQALELFGTTHFYLSKPCKPSDIKETIRRTQRVLDNLPNESLREQILSLDCVPSSAATLTTIGSEFEKGNPAQVADLIVSDIGLYARMLQVVGSSFLGRQRSDCDLRQSIASLDQNLLRKLFEADGFAEPWPEQHAWFPVNEVVQECRAISVLAGRIAEIESGSEEEIAASCSAGWLSGIGRLVLATVYPEEYQDLRQLVCSRSMSLVEAEVEYFGCDHFQVGAFLLGVWGLPMPVVNALIDIKTGFQLERAFSPSVILQAAYAIVEQRLASESRTPILDRASLAQIESSFRKRWVIWSKLDCPADQQFDSGCN